MYAIVTVIGIRPGGEFSPGQVASPVENGSADMIR